jgi:hypothetical protein
METLLLVLVFLWRSHGVYAWRVRIECEGALAGYSARARARAREDTWLAPDGARQLVVMWRNIEHLIPYARNARTHSDAQIAQIAGSIREFGFTNPVLIDENGGISLQARSGSQTHQAWTGQADRRGQEFSPGR